jgi:signal transduction protein with GAF and PtsI domain
MQARVWSVYLYDEEFANLVLTATSGLDLTAIGAVRYVG